MRPHLRARGGPDHAAGPTVPRGRDGPGGGQSAADHQTLKDQSPRALALGRACRRGAAKFRNTGSEGSGPVKAVLECSLARNPRHGKVVRVPQVGPHTAEQHCHPTLRILDGGRKLVLRCCAASSPRRTPLSAPNQGGGDASSKRRRGRAETCESPEQIRQGLLSWAGCDRVSTSGTQSLPALLRSSTVALECQSRVEFLRACGGSADSPSVRCLFVHMCNRLDALACGATPCCDWVEGHSMTPGREVSRERRRRLEAGIKRVPGAVRGRRADVVLPSGRPTTSGPADGSGGEPLTAEVVRAVWPPGPPGRAAGDRRPPRLARVDPRPQRAVATAFVDRSGACPGRSSLKPRPPGDPPTLHGILRWPAKPQR